MTLRIEKAEEIGFCFGVRRAIDILERAVAERGKVETLGAVVHNQQVLQRLAGIGVREVKSLDDMQGNVIAISSHGVSPQLQAEIKARSLDIIDTTCPYVQRAQVAARRLAESGFFVVIYGDADHPEVRGVLGWADNKGVVTQDEKFITTLDRMPRRLGVLSQTTQVPAHFVEFTKKFIDSAFAKDSELRIIDTICHDSRKRQETALRLANRVDLMLVIGSRSSANTRHLAELCSTAAKTYHIESEDDIQPSWFRNGNFIGVTSGASTAEQTTDEVLTRLEAMADSWS